ncbi:MAG: J domain-containing protein [Lysobacteraceae bacterium]|nr:MAG: J domain-containing protein [Xanthomonadaceae bacterium]
MAEDTDFAALYRELGIDASCTLTELRHAYRRRVAKLHPDQGGDAEDTGRLQRLNRLQAAAIDFHRRYGRLPGSAPGTVIRTTLSSTTAPPPPGALTGAAPRSAERSPANAIDHAEARARGRFDDPSEHLSVRRSAPSAHTAPTEPVEFGRMPRYFVAVALIAMFVLAWRAAGFGQTVVGEAPSTGMEPSLPPQTAKVIATGMGKQAVLDIQGEPLEMEALRWNYGPSWVEFRCDKVVDWYSSPLQPLAVAFERGAAAGTVAPHDAPCQ